MAENSETIDVSETFIREDASGSYLVIRGRNCNGELQEREIRLNTRLLWTLWLKFKIALFRDWMRRLFRR